MKKLQIIAIFALLTAFLSACNKFSDANPSYPYSVRMTDAPAIYDAINIDLRSVVVTGADGQDVTLTVNQGIYNLLDFTNGNDTLIATGTLATAEVEQIRLILGPNNTIVVDGDTYPLSTPSAEQSGLKLQVHQTLEAGVMYNVLIDFDANKSVVKTGTGTYKLKPVLRTIETAISGSISGNITPAGTVAVITATSATNITYTTVASASGYFLIQGVPSGVYTLTITPVFPFNAVTETNIMVNTGITTNIGTTTF